MKKITFLVASVLLVGNLAKASEIIITAGVENNMRMSFDEPISFVERGIEFFVFPNGDFDFNTRPNDSQGDYFYRKANNRGASAQARGNGNFGTLIEHDSFGRVRRVGNTFINYDNRDRISRIGSVYMKYNRFALSQIGGMKIIYNNRGAIVNTVGSIKGYSNQGFVYHNVYNNTYQNNYNDSYTSNYGQDNNYYYYRTDGSKARIEDKK